MVYPPYSYLGGGQDRAIRVKKAMTKCHKKFDDKIRSFNSLPRCTKMDFPHPLEKTHLKLDHDSEIWKHLSRIDYTDQTVPFTVKRRCTRNFHLLERATEEISIVQTNLNRLRKNIQEVLALLTQWIACTSEKLSASKEADYSFIQGSIALVISRQNYWHGYLNRVNSILKILHPGSEILSDQSIDAVGEFLSEPISSEKGGIDELLHELGEEIFDCDTELE